tara:strand:- start:3710 stop:4570 length:861 start_codon:yes stop_codon:yes gene_type:complete
MADVTERIEKQMEGTNLALAAVAEVLQKMDARLVKEESEKAQLAKSQAEANAKSDLVKSIAREVIASIKKEGSEQGLDVSGDERKANGDVGSSSDADDSEKAVNPTTKIEDQQNTIQASRLKKRLRKQENGEEETEEEEEVIEAGGMAYKQEDDEEEEADEEAADIPIEADEDMDEEEVEDETDEMKSMRKQIKTLEKALKDTKSGIQKAIKTESEERLRKMGFREETGLKAPKIAGLGVDNTPIVKSATGDVTEQLVDLSYKELRDLQTKIMSGDTDGVPRELLN